MRIDILRKHLPDMPEEILDQLARVNGDPSIHRYVQLHNSFELVLRYLAITSYLWVKKAGEEPALVGKLARKLPVPSLDTWNEIFLACSKWLHEHGHIDRSPKANLDSQAAARFLGRVADIVPADNLPKKATSSGLMRAVIEYRNFTRGHGCFIYDGYEAFLDDLDSALFDFVLAWEALLNVPSLAGESGLVLRIGGEEVASDLFLQLDENGRIAFYNRQVSGHGSIGYYFLNYDTGLHHRVAEQGTRIREEVRLHDRNHQLGLFPSGKGEVERKYGRREVHEVKKYLSFDYAVVEELHPAQEAEIRFLIGLKRFSTNVRQQDPSEFLLSAMKKGQSPEDVVYDFTLGSWRSLQACGDDAVEEYLRSADVAEIAQALADRVHDEPLDDDEREELRGCLNAFEAALRSQGDQPSNGT